MGRQGKSGRGGSRGGRNSRSRGPKINSQNAKAAAKEEETSKESIAAPVPVEQVKTEDGVTAVVPGSEPVTAPEPAVVAKEPQGADIEQEQAEKEQEKELQTAAIEKDQAEEPAGVSGSESKPEGVAQEQEEYASTLSVEGTAFTDRLAEVTSVCSAGEYADPTYIEGDEAAAEEVPPAATDPEAIAPVAKEENLAESPPEEQAATEKAAALTSATSAAASGVGAAAAATPANDDTLRAAGEDAPSTAPVEPSHPPPLPKPVALSSQAEAVDAWIRDWTAWGQNHLGSLTIAAGSALAVIGLLGLLGGSGRRRSRSLA